MKILTFVLLSAVITAGGYGAGVKEVTKNETRKAAAYATLGGGCFWCMEAVFQRIEGIVSVESGYAGGTVEHPTYEEVCTGTTGHAEVVQLGFDPEVIGYDEVLSVFFQAHDPTTLNRQGADVGTQYRSVIFYHDEGQREIARKVTEETQKGLGSPIVTEIAPFKAFYKAEDYHQNYYHRNTYAGYCRAVINPKLKKLKLD